MTDEFKKIGLIGREDSALVVESLLLLIDVLEARNLEVVLSAPTAAMLPHSSGYQIGSREVMGDACDLVIVVGGDGSLLGAARSFARHRVPLLGVNRGRLGFLTDILPSEIEARILDVLDGHYIRESRFLLEAHVRRAGRPVGQNSALNDVVFHSAGAVKMVEFELFIEGQFVYRQRSDGLIVSTPTGSTAYALSGGGPIMHPRIDAIVLVPMCPHTLSSRPLVVDGNSEIKLVVGESSCSSMLVSCDGQGDITVLPGDVISIRKMAHKLTLLHPIQHDFYEACRSKLGWSEVL
ncbi:Inorganic polyphosphate/ATP-NAD kinase [gamma proteobacterium HdN1]|nr:Inorganic polyphosphate/ATP-NAD kinase [gamma proteobacterium HdN1]